ncbi:hypothetical protein BDN70DRAFT_892518 [Pholiota conissans]|uniref:F-box domain-containing protein n=1 Tax=Pholiota conissans TaxID=109636 RepID=A0A9P5Z940_9AGAR|nr:hypothetical protein BDN70DRAFT_892518 [Pholiota conissans]
MVSLSMTTTRSPISSFKKLLKSPQKTLDARPLPPTPKAPVERLPTPLISEIGRQLCLRDAFQLGVCSRTLHASLAPVLYSTVELKTNKHCKTALITFARRPEITRHIRRLIVRINSMEWTSPEEEVDEDLVATLIAKLSTQLGALDAFEWDGLEMAHDELWSSLRTKCIALCRHLKRISTAIGEDPLNSSSPLWDFNDLRQISLTVKCQSLEWLSEGPPKTEKLPRKFWAMLLERCPRLEELKIGGSFPSPRIFDIRHVTIGRWPCLRRITLGDMVLISQTKGEQQACKDHAAFMTFFAAHPNLRAVHLQHTGGSAHFPSSFSLPDNALPNVTSFSGPLKLVKSLPNLHNLRDLTLTTLHHTTSSFPATYAVLRDLKKLKSLSIWIDLSFGSSGSYAFGRTSGENMKTSSKYDDIHVLRSLATAIPTIKHLEISCFTCPPFSVRDFSRILQIMPNLESFLLTKVHKYNDDDPLKNAALVVAENPHIKHFTIRMTHDSWYSPMRGRIKHLGVYEVLGQASTTIPLAEQESEASSATSSIPPVVTTVLLAHEYGQRNITNKDYSRHIIHHVVPKIKETPPSSFGRHRHSLSLTRISSLARVSSRTSNHSDNNREPADPSSARSPSRSSSNASSFLQRSRRSSLSLVGSITNAMAAMTSPSSRASMPAAMRHTADQCQGSSPHRAEYNLGSNQGSLMSATGERSRPRPADSDGETDDDYVLV